MARKPPLNDDAPELTAAELAEMRPARDVMTPEDFAAVSSVRGRSRSAGAKVSAPPLQSDVPAGAELPPETGNVRKRRT